jgi:hypothetical protein
MLTRATVSENGVVTASGVVVGVYRRDRAQTMLDLVPDGWRSAFWALDSVAPAAAAVTVGSGPGAKFELCNRLLAAAAPGPGDWVVVVDDDVVVPAGLGAFLDRSAQAGLGLTQPAHSRHSKYSHQVTVRRPLLRARWGSYVEIGPVFAVSPEWRDRVLPFPEDMGMGWGVELLWMDLEREGLRLGIVDDVAMTHLVPPGLSYDLGPEGRRLEAMLAERGARQLADVMRIHGRWWRWQRRPSWVAKDAA